MSTSLRSRKIPEARKSMPAMQKDYKNTQFIMNTHRSKAVLKLLRNLSPPKECDKFNLPVITSRQDNFIKVSKTNLGRNYYCGLFLIKNGETEKSPHSICSNFTQSFAGCGMFKDSSISAASKVQLKQDNKNNIHKSSVLKTKDYISEKLRK